MNFEGPAKLNQLWVGVITVIANMVPGIAGDSLEEKDVRDGLATVVN